MLLLGVCLQNLVRSDLGAEFIIAGSCGLAPTGKELGTEEF